MDYKKIADIIKNSEKKTNSIFYIQTTQNLDIKDTKNCKIYGASPFYTIIGEYETIKKIIKLNKNNIKHYDYEIKTRKSALPSAELENIDSRVEPGAFIREGASIGKNCIIMMGSVINIGAQVGNKTMIDMNSVVGARAIIGQNCHIGAGAVIAGVLEPPSAKEVFIEDNVMVGANAVILEGVKVGENSVIGACSVVTKDVPENSVAVGIPAEIIKKKDLKTADKTKILKELR
ncbi:MAG: 2,3,4,5-tetrahydropyridine-2,6-dicarboxylate N-acetyltransferase [Candidatus Muiribacteriota bacterium]